MLPVYIGVYVFMLAVVWGFFLIARHHSYKFKHFSTNITPVTNMLLVFLLILSVLWFFMIFSLWDSNVKVIKIDQTQKSTQNYY